MTTLQKCYKVISSERVHATNTTHIEKGMSVCVNFIQLPYPEEATTLMTVTAMKNGRKLNCIPPMSFAKVMSCIEESLESFDDYFPYNVPLVQSLQDDWYIRIGCHRVFLVRTPDIFKTLSTVFSSDNVHAIKDEEICGIRVIINSLNHDMQIDM